MANDKGVIFCNSFLTEGERDVSKTPNYFQGMSLQMQGGDFVSLTSRWAATLHALPWPSSSVDSPQRRQENRVILRYLSNPDLPLPVKKVYMIFMS